MKIVVLVTSCNNNLVRRETIRLTWGKYLPPDISIYFLVGSATSSLSNLDNDVLTVPSPDDYFHLPQKQIMGIRKIVEKLSPDWLFVCDDDTYVVPRRLETLCRSTLSKFVGNEAFSADGQQFAYGGSGFLLHKDVFELILPVDMSSPLFEIMPPWADYVISRMILDKGVILKVDKRFSKGKYSFGERKFVARADGKVHSYGYGIPTAKPSRKNTIISSHFITPNGMKEIFEHFKHKDNPLDNSYTIRSEYDGQLIYFKEMSNGRWSFILNSCDKPIGEFEFTEDCEKYAIETSLCATKIKSSS